MICCRYAITIAHTLDDEFRNKTPVGVRRSQTFSWVVGSLCVYLADRLWCYVTTYRGVRVLEARQVDEASPPVILLTPHPNSTHLLYDG